MLFKIRPVTSQKQYQEAAKPIGILVGYFDDARLDLPPHLAKVFRATDPSEFHHCTVIHPYASSTFKVWDHRRLPMYLLP